MIKQLLYLFLFFAVSACTVSSSDCVYDRVRNFKNTSGFDYFDFVQEFENYLIKTKLLRDESRESWLLFFKNEGYCLINEDDLLSNVDNSFSTAPNIGGTFFQCQSELKEPIRSIEIDSIISNLPKYSISLLEKIGNEDFQMIENKMFFVYQTNILIGVCGQ